MNGQTKICTWYADKFPQDEWGVNNINKGINFQDVYECLEIGGNIYALLGGVDSIIRERVFDALATLMGCSYDLVYYQWLHNEKKPYGRVRIIDMHGLRFNQ